MKFNSNKWQKLLHSDITQMPFPSKNPTHNIEMNSRWEKGDLATTLSKQKILGVLANSEFIMDQNVILKKQMILKLYYTSSSTKF